MKKGVLSLVLFAAISTQPLQAQTTDSPHWNTPGAGNPFIPGYFADPTIRRFGDTWYLYATTDGTGNGYGPAQVWVSKDFVNWQNIIMNWPTSEVVWAPDVIQAADGTYRYFYCQPCQLHEGSGLSPVGPWTNVMGAEDAVLVPDRFVHNAITLDGQTFVDDDGQTYLYFGTWGIYKGFGCGVARLGSDLKSFTDKKLIPNTEITDFFEAPYVFKRGGTYYFTYSSGSCHDESYRVQYATSTVGPMGPYEYKGCILQTNDDKTVHGPGHHSILEQDGHYYIVCHRHNLPRSAHGFNRQICIDELTFDAEGNILTVEPTHGAPLISSYLVPRISHLENLAFGAKATASSY
jgi:beta-xylosidase